MKKIVVIGGGSGTSMVLRGLRQSKAHLSAIVAMADDGGSSGILRRELGVLPPGDVRQCLLALATKNKKLQEIFNYRFSEGQLRGHNLGNLIIAALEKSTGGFAPALRDVSAWLGVAGEVHPSTFDEIDVVAYLGARKIIGQSKIHISNLRGLTRLTLEPRAKANPPALRAIAEADAIVIGPGDIFSSVLPALIPVGLVQAIKKSRAKKIYIANLTTKAGHTDNFSVHDFAALIGRYVGALDAVIYDETDLPVSVFRREARKGEGRVAHVADGPCVCRGARILDKNFSKVVAGDLLTRNRLKHDSKKLAKVILSIMSEK